MLGKEGRCWGREKELGKGRKRGGDGKKRDRGSGKKGEMLGKQERRETGEREKKKKS